MKGKLSHDLLSRFSEFIAAKTALHFPRERWIELESKALKATGEFGFADVGAFIQWIVSAPVTQEQIEMLASHLTVSETYFWREPKVFEALVEHILPELARLRGGNGKALRIWSAGCSTGEEAYSIAIALHRAIPDPDDWSFTLLATDINPRILRKANAGVYGEWSFRNAPPWLIDAYFRHSDGGKLEILPEIRKMVTFSYLNLAEDVYPSTLNNTGAMDIIFCRNVLMYFTQERAKQVVLGLHRSLVDGGWLLVGSSELSQQLFPQFASVNFPGAVAYRKETAESRLSTHVRLERIPPQQEIIQTAIESVAEAERPALQDLFLIHETKKANVRPTGEDARLSRTRLIRELADGGKLVEALALCDTAIAADKLDPCLHYLRGVILQEQNNDVEAISSLKRTLYLDPNHALAYFNMGNLVRRQGDVKSAKKYFDNVLELVSACRQEEILPEAEGLTAGRFRKIIQATIQMGAPS